MSEPKPLLKPLPPATLPRRLWSGGAFVADPFQRVDDAEALPPDGDVVLSLARWRRDGVERAVLAASGRRIGLALEIADTLDPLRDDLARAALVTLPFARFSDGRAYSVARRLREQWGYLGQIRATGDVLFDQLPLMLRSGFDAFDIVDAGTIRALEQGALAAVSRTYQHGTETQPYAWHARRRPAGRDAAE
jgi:uncharacterized protein (DUF934 family)